MSDRTRRRQGTAESRDESGGRAGVAIIGVGAVGSSLARSLHQAGYRILALISRSLPISERIASETSAATVSDSIADVPADARLLFICTREDAIPVVVGRMLAIDMNLRQRVVAHVSGRLNAHALSALAERGALTLSFHPLGSFPPGPSLKTLKGLTIGLEGDELAVAVGEAVALDLAARPVVIPSGAKAAYHLAASMTSNFLVTLLGDVKEVLEAAGLPPDLTHSLAVDTMENLHSATPEEALTGPIARADARALAEQIRTLKEVAPGLLPRFVSLAAGTIEMAARNGRISSEEQAALRRILEDPT